MKVLVSALFAIALIAALITLLYFGGPVVLFFALITVVLPALFFFVWMFRRKSQQKEKAGVVTAAPATPTTTTTTPTVQTSTTTSTQDKKWERVTRTFQLIRSRGFLWFLAITAGTISILYMAGMIEPSDYLNSDEWSFSTRVIVTLLFFGAVAFFLASSPSLAKFFFGAALVLLFFLFVWPGIIDGISRIGTRIAEGPSTVRTEVLRVPSCEQEIIKVLPGETAMFNRDDRCMNLRWTREVNSSELQVTFIGDDGRDDYTEVSHLWQVGSAPEFDGVVKTAAITNCGHEAVTVRFWYE